MSEIGLAPEKSQLFCDHKAIYLFVENPVQHDRTKPIEVDRHFNKETMEKGAVELQFF